MILQIQFLFQLNRIIWGIWLQLKPKGDKNLLLRQYPLISKIPLLLQNILKVVLLMIMTIEAKALLVIK